MREYRSMAGRAKPPEPRHRWGLGWAFPTCQTCCMTLSYALWPEPAAHKLHICATAAPQAGASLTWHGLPLSVLAYMSLKDSLIKEIKYQPQTLKYNLDPKKKIIRGHKAASVRGLSLRHHGDSEDGDWRFKGGDQKSLKSGFQKIEQGS